MNTPTITPMIGGYRLIWSAEELSCTIRRLDVHSDGRVTGELQISNSSLENPIILLPSTQFNFSAERTRQSQAKDLKTKYPDNPCNWTELFDYLGHKVQELARTGEPSEEIYPCDEVHPPASLLHPVIYEGVSNLIYGEKGVNKSTLCYLLAGTLALPWRDNPLGFGTTDKPHRTLILDWETNAYVFKYYLNRLYIGCQIPMFYVRYRHCTLPLSEELESIAIECEQHNIDVVVIDSLAAAAGGGSDELKGSSSALKFNEALRQLGKTSLIIGQTSKSQEGKKSVYGSVLFTYYARNIFELCRSDDDDTDTLHLALFHRECNFARKSEPIGLTVTYDGSRSISVKRSPLSVAEFIEKVKTTDRLADLLKHGPLSQKEIMDKLDIKAPNARQSIHRLTVRGLILKIGEKYALLAKD